MSPLESIEAARVEQLSKIPPLSLLAPEELAEVLGVCEEIFLEAGAIVFQAGDPGDAFFVVLSGRLKVWGSGLEGGQLGELTPGELFGERALILGQPRHRGGGGGLQTAGPAPGSLRALFRLQPEDARLPREGSP